MEPTDVEGVHPHELARPLSLYVPLGLTCARRLVRGGVAGDERETLGACIEPMSAQAAPDAVVADDETTPALPAQFRGDPGRAEAGGPSAKATIRPSTSGES